LKISQKTLRFGARAGLAAQQVELMAKSPRDLMRYHAVEVRFTEYDHAVELCLLQTSRPIKT
jgi:hypothetical protein